MNRIFSQIIVEALKTVCCFKHEIVVEDKNKCQMQEFTCDHDKSVPLNCSKKIDPPFCACKPGYMRTKCGFCVEKDKCVKECYVQEPIWCPAGNETLYGCHDASQRRICPHLRESSDDCDMSRSDGYTTTNVCDCEPGYYLNECKKCVALEDCETECTITADDPCSDPNARRGNENEKKTCKQFLNDLKRKKRDISPTKKGRENVCVCKENFVLDDCGRCISEEECKSELPCKCTCPCNRKKYEDYRCFTPCYERTCEYLDQRYFRRCSLPCRYGCDCEFNRYRYTDPHQPNQIDSEKKCIPTKDCPQSSPSFYENID